MEEGRQGGEMLNEKKGKVACLFQHRALTKKQSLKPALDCILNLQNQVKRGKGCIHSLHKLARPPNIHTRNSALDGCAVLELDGHRLVVQFHQKSVSFMCTKWDA